MDNKYFLPPDVYIRHLVVAREIAKRATVLDVGGSLGELRKFLPNLSITTADVVKGGDVVYDGSHLPFPDEHFDVVASVDTLEHVPFKKRLDLFLELARVAKKKVVLVAPYASPDHVAYERSLYDQLKREKKQIPPYLEEHVSYGLVGKGFIDSVRKEYSSARITILGSTLLDKINFSIHLYECRLGICNRALYYIKQLWNVGSNILAPLLLQMRTVQNASRVLIVIQK